MLFNNTYKEIQKNSKSIYKDKGSKFIAYAFPIYSEKEAKKYLERIRTTEKSANHHCYAYVIHPDKSLSKSNDDGEPNSTAGRPILKQIEKYELTNILIVVVRYFGGIKLGIPGLIRAYKNSALNVIQESDIITKIIKEKYIVKFEHGQMNNVMRIIKDHRLEIIHTDFQSDCKLTFLVPKEKSDFALASFRKNHKLIITYN